jgi:MFS transporter, NNP family, nitrate/nitrite transporter
MYSFLTTRLLPFIQNMAWFGKTAIHPETGKAINFVWLNVRDKYCRTFHFAWFSFFVAFFSWFAFPPLLASSIKQDLQLSTSEIQNSNVIGLTSTLFVRIVTGSLCDRYGPRKVMAWLLLLGSASTVFVLTINDAVSLSLVRFFIGILGGTFVPCQVWITAFFDTSIVGTANALAAGWGNAGGGAVFFVMPALVESFVDHHQWSLSFSWKISFIIVPLVLISATAILILVFGDDCPQGPWELRYLPVPERRRSKWTLNKILLPWS